VGYGNKVAAEVNIAACTTQGVPIFRRCSGGGAVVQMPGGLNYSLILRITESGPTRNISAANQFIMERNCAAVQAALGPPPPLVSVRGHTDLAVEVFHEPQRRPVVQPAGSGTVPVPGSRTGGETPPKPTPPIPNRERATVPPTAFLKVAGNSQRRRKQFLLFHGTLLLNCDLRLISKLLPMPSLQPDYRASRSHAEFVANLHLPAAAVKVALARVWNAEGEMGNPPLAEMEKLAQEKYLTREWNFKF